MNRIQYLMVLLTAISLGESVVLGQAVDCVKPTIEPEGQIFLCPGGKTQLKTTPSASAYQWFRDDVAIDGATQYFLDITTPGDYTVTVFEGDCINSSERKAVVEAGGENRSPQVKIVGAEGFRFCEGGSATLSVEGNFTGYLWSTGARTATVTVEEPGTYTVEAFVGACTLLGEVTVTTLASPDIEISASRTDFRLGESIELFATGAQELTWFPSEGLNDTLVANPTAAPTKTTTYYVTGISANGCRDTTAITLYLDESALNLSPPKVFSPNDDNIDDFWIIENVGRYVGCELIIFNRQGQEVFKASPYANNWDGIYRGRPLPEGDYYYVMRCGGKENLKTGSILLVR